MSTNNVDKSLDDLIKERRNKSRSFRGRGRGTKGRWGRDRGDRRDRSPRDGRRRGRGGKQNNNRGGNRDENRGRFNRDERRPRRNYNRRNNKNDSIGGTRLFVKDLPITISNNDLRVYYHNSGNIPNLW